MDATIRQRGMEVRGLESGRAGRANRLSVRTLHDYDESGLLSSSQRTDSELPSLHAGDVVCLQQTKSL